MAGDPAGERERQPGKQRTVGTDPVDDRFDVGRGDGGSFGAAHNHPERLAPTELDETGPRYPGDTGVRYTRPGEARPSWRETNTLTLVLALSALLVGGIIAALVVTLTGGGGSTELGSDVKLGSSLPTVAQSGPDPASGVQAPAISGTDLKGDPLSVAKDGQPQGVFVCRRVPTLTKETAEGESDWSLVPGRIEWALKTAEGVERGALTIDGAIEATPDTAKRPFSDRAKLPIADAAAAYFGLGTALSLDWLREQIESLGVEGHWQAVARTTLRDNIYNLQRMLCMQVLTESRKREPAKALQSWIERHKQAVDYVRQTVSDMRALPAMDFATLSVALQAVRRMAES